MSVAPTRTIGRADVVVAYQELASTETGQIVLHDLMRHFAFNTKTTFVKDDPHHTAYHEGQRSVLVHIGLMMEMDPAQAAEIDRQQEQGYAEAEALRDPQRRDDGDPGFRAGG